MTVTPATIEDTGLPDVRSIPTGNPASTGELYNGDLILYGWTFTETSGAATAQVDLFDGGNAQSTLIASITLAAGQSTRDWLAGSGIHCLQGVFVNVVTGSARGAIWAQDL